MADTGHLRRLLELLGREGEPIRLVRGDSEGVMAALMPYDQLDAAVASANEHGWNLWFEVQPSHYDRPTGRSSAGDISALVALYADIDYKPKPSGMGSMPEASDLVRDLEGVLGVPPTAIVHTGHGMQPYWALERVTITPDNRNHVASVLKRWGILVRQFAQVHHGGLVDNVFDMARILRAPGSVNNKEAANPIPTVTDFTSPVPPKITLAELEEALDDYGITSAEVEVATEIVSPEASWEWAEKDCEFVEVLRIEIEDSIPAGRHPWMLKESAILYGLIREGCITEEGWYDLRERLVQRFIWLCENREPRRKPSMQEINAALHWGKGQAESWSPQKLAEEMRQHTHAEFAIALGRAAAEAQYPPMGLMTPNSPHEQLATVSSIFTGQPVNPTAPATDGALALDVELRIQERLGAAAYTDTGNAERLAQQLRGRYLWVPQLGWHYWDGARYAVDTGGGGVVEQAKDLFMYMLRTASEEPMRKWASSSLNQARINAAINLAKSVPYLTTDAIALDAAAYEMATPGGVLDLRTATLRDADPLTDRHTLRTAYTPEPGEPTRFLQFLRWAIEDESVISYLQRLFGVAAIGELRWHVFPIFLGVGANGKSTLMDIMCGVFGQYAAVMPDRFLIKKSGESHPTEIAQLRAVRLASVSEVPPNSQFDESLVKRLTGETRLRGRYMHKDFFDFDNMCTFILQANHLPKVLVGGSGWWRRVRKIDFEKTMPLERQDPNLARNILLSEGPQIMNWVAEGARAVLQGGLQDPAKVLSATRVYQLEEDAIARFIAERLYVLPNPVTTVPRQMVYDDYRMWMIRQGADALDYMRFCREITMQLPTSNLGTRDVFTGLMLTVQYNPEDSEEE